MIGATNKPVKCKKDNANNTILITYAVIVFTFKSLSTMRRMTEKL